MAAGACILLLYTGIVPCINRHSFKSLGEVSNLCSLAGSISSNPSVNSEGTFYSSTLDSKSSSFLYKINNSKESKIESSATGRISILIPSQFVEVYSPGKLFSISNDGMLIETGAFITCNGSWSVRDNAFVISSIESCCYKNTVAGAIDHFRAVCRLFFKRLMYSWGSAGALILSLLSGSRDYLSKSVRDGFKNAGLSHILALSGMHLSFFSGIACSSGKRIVGKKNIFIIQIAAVIMFVWFAGLSPSLFRALLCSVSMLIASKTTCRSTDFKAVLAGAFLIHTVCFPSDVFTAAFMLSYGALAGILLLSTPLTSMLSRYLPTVVSDSLSASAGAQIATTPISISIFGTMTPIGLIASIIVSPMVTFFLTLSLIFIILSLTMPFLSPLFGGILTAIYKVILYFVNLFSRAPQLIFK